MEWWSSGVMGKPTHLVPLHPFYQLIVASMNEHYASGYGKRLPNEFTFMVERQLIIPKMTANVKHVSLLIPNFRLSVH